MYKNYTFIEEYRNAIYHTYINERGEKKYEVIRNYPFKMYQKFFPQSNDVIEYKSIFGEPLQEIDLESVYALKQYVRDRGRDKVFGMEKPLIQYLYNTYGERERIEYDMSDIKKLVYDIETESGNGLPFPDPKNPVNAIISISAKFIGRDVRYTFGLKDYQKRNESDVYFKCKDEHDLILTFIKFIRNEKPDMLIGWNSRKFDDPYFVQRAMRVVGKDEVFKLSPFYGKTGKHDPVYTDYWGDTKILGITLIDYMEAYKALNYGLKPPSFKLDDVGEFEEVGNKLDYSEYGSLQNFYEQNPQKFYEYNEIDVELIEKIDEGRNFLLQIITKSYVSITNFEMWDKTTVPVDALFYKEIQNKYNKRLIIPPHPSRNEGDDRKLSGGYVGKPIQGLHGFGVSFDAKSLYPSIIDTWNMSPETYRDVEGSGYMVSEQMLAHLTGKYDIPFNDLQHWYNNNIPVDENKLYDNLQWILEKVSPIKEGFIVAGNKTEYVKDQRGFLPFIIQTLMGYRVQEQKIKRELEQKLLNFTGTEEERFRLEQQIQSHDGMQHAFKILLNSIYGAFLAITFRYHKFEIGEAITATGRFFIKFISESGNKLLKELAQTDENMITYNDTDSVYFNLQPIVDNYLKCGHLSDGEIADKIDDFCQRVLLPYIDRCIYVMMKYVNTETKSMIMERENIYKSIFFLAPKMYAVQTLDNEGKRYKNPKITPTGIRIVRGDIPQYVREGLTDILEAVFDKDEERIISINSKVVQQHYQLSPLDMGVPSGVNNIEKYTEDPKGGQAHVMGAVNFNNLIIESEREGTFNHSVDMIRDGDKIRWLYLKENNEFGLNSISFRDENDLSFIESKMDLDNLIDKDRMLERTYTKTAKEWTDIVNIPLNESEQRTNFDLPF